jgi:hypothetical protein
MKNYEIFVYLTAHDPLLRISHIPKSCILASHVRLLRLHTDHKDTHTMLVLSPILINCEFVCKSKTKIKSMHDGRFYFMSDDFG